MTSLLREVLQGIRQSMLDFAARWHSLHDDAPPILRALSPLAEGADRIFAEQALDLGYRLAGVLPFGRGEYEHDFAPPHAQEPDSPARFHGLLARCETVLELDGTRTGPDPYGACGSVVVENADLMVVVWDGRRERRTGGTETALDLALSLSIPVLWIPTAPGARWGILRKTSDLPDEPTLGPAHFADAAALRALVPEVLAVPGDDPAELPTGLRCFQREILPARSWAIAWRGLHQVLAEGRLPSLDTRVRPLALEADHSDGADARLAEHFAWANQLAGLYADRYRSAFVFSFLVAAFAVAMALVPVGLELTPHGAAEITCIVLEIISIVTILVVVVRGRRGRWHERWIDYRLVAESLRQVRLTSPIEGQRPMPTTPEHQSEYGRPASNWTGWYVRAVERGLPLPNVVLDHAAVDAALVRLRGVLRKQKQFHHDAAHRAHALEHRLHRIGMTLLGLTLLACSIHLVGSIWHLPHWIGPASTFICGFFPALGAAFAGIAHQGEFRRVHKRSRAMEQVLTTLEHRVESLRQEPAQAAHQAGQPSRRAAALATNCSQVMLQEVLDWRVVFLDQPLRPPA